MGKDSLNVLGASNLSKAERSKLDYYGTAPKSTQALLAVEKFQHRVWEPCAGRHLISKELEAAGYEVESTDIADYGFGDRQADFLEYEGEFDGDIVTNPPYCQAMEFAIKALGVVKPGAKVAMFLRLLFLEGTKRYERLFKENPPKAIYVFSNRQVSDKDDDFDKGSAVAFAWFVWEKGSKAEPIIRWISTK